MQIRKIMNKINERKRNQTMKGKEKKRKEKHKL
jgi:hypothetical protein